MKIKLICVGRLKEDYFKAAADEYIKRLSRFHKLEIIEIAEDTKIENPSEAEKQIAMENECQKILKTIGKNSYVVALAIEGTNISSEDLAVKLEKLALGEKSEVCFIIGGSFGLSPKIINTADFLLSFSKMTFTYQLSRVIFLEQLYRASKINAGECYHK
ncbi:MAG: 23S rRNA (pseudouridine(1915)-N(3))-methyltransferase RlmH [Bacillota bacterium]|nr:23S rRNA (pseudouridine(1915)-N(3))-methyltransferase RlmH [Bacillota bacterium]